MKWLDKRRAKRHEEIKKEIKMMQENKSYLILTKSPQYLIDEADKRLKKLEEKLSKGRIVKC